MNYQRNLNWRWLVNPWNGDKLGGTYANAP